ncbi:MAG TPA: GlsB/YeaQ/YmgE family stress response membrane protein [Candidatus Polarisedimenticolaceae bacterium]|nr:GlsB/YeaQ/YmgE family stress response membrane protein [Candidatus Polarisedimenticolaceae bacterium]
MDLLSILAWIVFGGLAGWIASIVMRTNEEQGAVGNVIVGIIGAIIGGYLMQALGGTGTTGFNFYSLLVAILGAIVLLAIVNVFRRGSMRA